MSKRSKQWAEGFADGTQRMMGCCVPKDDKRFPGRIYRMEYLRGMREVISRSLESIQQEIDNLERVQHSGVITRIAYYADEPEDDHVEVRLDWDGETLVDCYRFQVEETGPAECQEETWRRYR